jgi:hypothetical protein
MASTAECYEGGMGEETIGARLETGVPGEFTHQTNIDPGARSSLPFVTQARRAESSSCCLVKVSWRSRGALIPDHRDKEGKRRVRGKREGLGRRVGRKETPTTDSNPCGRLLPGFATKMLGKGW